MAYSFNPKHIGDDRFSIPHRPLSTSNNCPKLLVSFDFPIDKRAADKNESGAYDGTMGDLDLDHIEGQDNIPYSQPPLTPTSNNCPNAENVLVLSAVLTLFTPRPNF